MTNSSSRKQGFFLKLWRLQKSAVARFPALFVLEIVTAVAMAEIYMDNSSHELEEFMNRLAYAGTWGMLFSLMAQLLVERRFEQRAQLAAQAIIFAMSIFVLPLLFLQIERGERREVLLVGVTLALCAIIMFILMHTQGNDIAFPNCIASAVIAGIFAICAIIVSEVLRLVSNNLYIAIPYYIFDNVFTLLPCISLFVLFPMIFIAFATRDREQISLSAAYKVIVLQILLTIEILFLALLYLYLFKCLFMRTFLEREIFLYISFATSGYLFFYFASMPDESPFFVFFRRYGALFMLPLVAMQIFAFVIKIDAEGYTPARVAALLYIIFSIASCALALIKRGKYMPLTFLIFAALCILGSATPLNIIDLAKWMQ
ncbi:MAG: DUF4153 domain-containing protein [Treponemataceae bacterium]|nr:DUF4153 domain-containing protein [Treponemataceae bacterium]